MPPLIYRCHCIIFTHIKMMQQEFQCRATKKIFKVYFTMSSFQEFIKSALEKNVE
jgi:hypothetical protein